MDMHKKLEEQLCKKTGKIVQVIPWGMPISQGNDRMDIQVGYHSAGVVDTFQLLVELPQDENGWQKIENKILRMVKACYEER